jgi:hypothetical protein
LAKKASELATLCNTKAYVIVYPEGKSVPQVFSSQDEVMATLNHFRSMTDDHPLNKKMEQECFLKKRMGKLQQQALKSDRNLEELKIRLLLHKSMLVGHAGLSLEELTNFDYNLEVHLKSIRDRITKIHGQPPVYMPSQEHPPTPNFITSMATNETPTMYQAQGSMPYVSNDMGTIGDPTVHQDQAQTSYITRSMETTRAPMIYQDQAPSRHEEWIELMRSGGGDL